MAFVVETGAGLANANSFASVEYGDTYHNEHGAPAEWTAAEQAVKEDALRRGTQYLEVLYRTQWKGTKVSATQALSFPRRDIRDSDQFLLPFDTMPAMLKDACCEAALRIVKGDNLMPDIAEPGAIASESVKLGPIATSVEYVGGKGESPRYTIIEGLLQDLLAVSGSVIKWERS